ncbi:hypothetical protein L1276_000680 [Flavobacterium sp. HSC-32F16]|uniref:hypothetical protein n=1 Tax=Flavobacterium sp. HSC-32F16 TaxID=2910964 RepID=UPI0020A46CD2|nr:hypothetical protein [Flavobacterium sp. HSC-32F16]MCP2025540.1 hypothetical protein [Flavobacterium sp. HSC-32F16]
MKKTFLISLLIIIILYAFKQLVYNPYKWKKAINTPEHKLQSGSFIFSKQRGSNGSQSMENKYFIFKVIAIDGDYVRLSVIRQLSEKDKLKQSNFSTTKQAYNDLKDSIHKITITPILPGDLYKEGASFTLNDYLLAKYPALNQSRYYYEDVKLSVDSVQYFSLVYSKEKIISKGKLVPWILNNSTTPELAERLSENIDLILN